MKNHVPSIPTATTMTTASSNDEDEALAESKFIVPNEPEIFFFTQEDARIEHGKEPVVLAQAKADDSTIKKQHQLTM